MNGFLLYRPWRSSVESLSDEDAGKWIKLIFAYEDGDAVVASGIPGTAFNFVKPTLDRDRSAYEERCERNRANGSKGGRPPKKEEDPVDDLFDLFWEAYPRKDAKANARKAFRKVTEKVLRETILPDLERRKSSEQWTKDGGAYIPYASTYINQRRWEDPISKKKRNFEQREVRDSDFDDLFLDLNQSM